MDTEFEVRNPYRSSHRTEWQVRRTAVELAQVKPRLKALANKVLSRSSDSNRLSKLPRIEQFEQVLNRPIPIETKFEGNPPPALLISDPTGPCPACESVQLLAVPGQPWHCRVYEPDMASTATTLTLPCHKVELRPVAAHAGLRTLENACRGLSIKPERLHQELETGGDMPDLVSGALTPKALRLIAKTLALMRYPPESERPPEICRKNTGNG
jgi:hypothetical protein